MGAVAANKKSLAQSLMDAESGLGSMSASMDY